MRKITSEQLIQHGLAQNQALSMCETINTLLKNHTTELAWKNISQHVLLPTHPFSLHRFLFSTIYPEWPNQLDSAPAYLPDSETIKTTNIYQFMETLGIHDVAEFHTWTVKQYSDFWQKMLDLLHIQFDNKPKTICDLSKGIESPSWLVDAKLNIINSCFTANPKKTALIFQAKNGPIHKMSYGELLVLTNRIANSLIAQGFKPSDSIGIVMPMTAEAVAIYLGIIKMGGVVVSIADSFSPEEIATRLNIANAKGVFTQDVILRDQKKLPLYEKMIAAKAPKTIVLSHTCALREGDINWQSFLLADDTFTAHSANPMDTTNILFSSGTTGDPKAIPWNHTTGIKSASDAFFHQNVQPDDVLAWPTSLGWMMGPWLIFSTFLNQASLALYYDLPRDQDYGKFIQDAKVTMLGVVPTLVASWRQSECMQGLDWSTIKRFTSTAECSNAEDMLYLMSRAGYKPVIEYCGGTETGGGYLTSTMIEKNYPSLFTSPAMGMDFAIIDETGHLTDNGELALIPPSIGLSTTLLNADHHAIYYAYMPKTPDGKTLRRHGDQIQRLKSGNYCILGRSDDTMNLGGIKISSAEIERAIKGIAGITETAAIAVNLANHGPSSLVIYAATNESLDKNDAKKNMQSKINLHLNPLFKIYDVVFKSELPKTASNKIMRRILRDEYQSLKHNSRG